MEETTALPARERGEDGACMEKNTLLLQDTEAFMRGELDNVTVAGGSIVLDLVQGSYVPYGCYTSAAIPMPPF